MCGQPKHTAADFKYTVHMSKPADTEQLTAQHQVFATPQQTSALGVKSEELFFYFRHVDSPPKKIILLLVPYTKFAYLLHVHCIKYLQFLSLLLPLQLVLDSNPAPLHLFPITFSKSLQG